MFAETMIIPQQVAEAAKAKQAAKKPRRKTAKAATSRRKGAKATRR